MRELSLEVDRAEECHPESGQSPSAPDRPTELARLADGYAGHDRHRSYGECCRKQCDTGDDWTVSSDAFEVERLIVEQRPQRHTMECRSDVRNVCCPVREDDKSQDRLCRNSELVKSSEHESDDPSAEWNRDSPAQPVVLYTAPADGNEDGRHTSNKHEGSDPVGLLEFGNQWRRRRLETNEKEDHDDADGNEWHVEPEDPSPKGWRCEGAAYYRSRNTAESPDSTEYANPVSAIPQRHKVGDQDIGQGNDSAATRSLDCATNKHQHHVFCQSTYNGAQKEQGDSEQTQRFATEDMAEGCIDRLEDGTGQQERRSGPEGFHGSAIQFVRDDRQSHRDGGAIKSDDQR